MSLHAPSPTPSPGPTNGRSPNFRALMGPTSSRPSNIATQGLSPGSPRLGGIAGTGRPTSELLSGPGMFQTPEGALFLLVSCYAWLTDVFQPRQLTSGSRICRTTRPLSCVSTSSGLSRDTDIASQEEMAAASLDVNFKEELSAIEQCRYLCILVRNLH